MAFLLPALRPFFLGAPEGLNCLRNMAQLVLAVIVRHSEFGFALDDPANVAREIAKGACNHAIGPNQQRHHNGTDQEQRTPLGDADHRCHGFPRLVDLDQPVAIALGHGLQGLVEGGAGVAVGIVITDFTGGLRALRAGTRNKLRAELDEDLGLLFRFLEAGLINLADQATPFFHRGLQGFQMPLKAAAELLDALLVIGHVQTARLHHDGVDKPIGLLNQRLFLERLLGFGEKCRGNAVLNPDTGRHDQAKQPEGRDGALQRQKRRLPNAYIDDGPKISLHENFSSMIV